MTRTVTTHDLLVEAAWAQRLARSLLGEEGDDVVQEGFIAALQTRPAADRPLRPWLRRVLTNLASNRARARRRHQAHLEAAARETSAPAASAEDLLARLESQKTLATLVSALEEPYRQTVLLHFYEGLTSSEIERLHKVPAATVRWRLKQALQRLRQQLDNDDQKHRRDWRLMLMPLLPGAPVRLRVGPASQAAILSLAIGVMGVLGVTMWRWWPGAEAAAGGGAALSEEPPGESGGHDANASEPASPRLLAAVTADLSTCHRRLAEVRAGVGRIEPDYLRVAPPEALFNGAPPNRVAAAALGPVVTRVMKAADGHPVDHVLECRDWVCRVLVLDRGDPNAWMKILQSDVEMLERTRVRGFRVGRPARDPASGAAVEERTVWLKLAALDGGRLPGDTMGPIPARTWPEPTSLGDCQRQLAAVEKLVREMRMVIVENERIDITFSNAAADPALTREFGRLVKEAVAGTPGVGEPQVECRAGRLCRIVAETAVGTPADAWWRKVSMNPAIRPMVARGSFGKGVYLRLHPPGTADGMALLKRVVAEWQASPALAECAREHPATGEMRIRFSLPATGDNSDLGQGRISADVGGGLADTPLARCAMQAAEQLVLGTPLPELVSGATLLRKVSFPPEASTVSPP